MDSPLIYIVRSSHYGSTYVTPSDENWLSASLVWGMGRRSGTVASTDRGMKYRPPGYIGGGSACMAGSSPDSGFAKMHMTIRVSSIPL